MAPDVAALERLEDHAMAVDAQAIEGEFTRIWRETEGHGEEVPSIRVRVLNLVAIGTAPDDVNRFEEAMQVLPQRHPCRGVLAVASASHDRLAASISAHCWRTGAMRRRVCSEEVVLTGAPRQERELASAVLGLLVPELPVAIWMMGAPGAPGALAGRLLDSGDTAIVDSGRAPVLRDGYAAISAIGEEPGLACVDLAWMRLAAWRALIAQMFDGEAGARELQQIDEVEISGGAGAVSSEAMLLGGWIASRLDFALADATADGGGLRAALYDGTRSVGLRFAPGTTTLDHVRIRTSDAEFAIDLHADSGHLHVREAWDSGATRRVVEQAPQDDGSVIALALDGLGELAPYREALSMATSLLQSE
jgi:glucose-6-phosphate dehydrogenase assembly protein OpcA